MSGQDDPEQAQELLQVAELPPHLMPLPATVRQYHPPSSEVTAPDVTELRHLSAPDITDLQHLTSPVTTGQAGVATGQQNSPENEL